MVCMDARKSHAVLPCMHMCVCEACSQQLLELGAQLSIANQPILETDYELMHF